jgi:hypothetical protein
MSLIHPDYLTGYETLILVVKDFAASGAVGVVFYGVAEFFSKHGKGE